MPQAIAQNQGKRSGLGRGLASLIPTGDNRPSLGAGAADVILGANGINGGHNRAAQPGVTKNSDSQNLARGLQHPTSTGARDKQDKAEPPVNRHRDELRAPSDKGQEQRENSKSVDKEPGKHVQDANSENQSVSNDEAQRTVANDFGAEYRELPIAEIRTNAKQPRQVFDEEALNELVHSIREFGLMQPIVVRYSPDADSQYELIMGERRLRAATKAGLAEIPAIVRATDDDAMLRDALLENIHRVQLNPLEEAAAYQQLLEEFGVTQSQLAQKLGRSRPLITNMIRLLQLPVAVQRRVGAGVLSAGHARALLGVRAPVELADDEGKVFVQRAQDQIADRIVAEGLSVRATEEAVTLLNRGDSARKKKSGRAPQELSPEVSSWVDDISDALDTKVSVQMGKKRGKIVVEFGGPDDFDRITELLKYRR